MSTVTPHPVHGEIIHFFNDRSSKVEQAIVLATVVGEIPDTYDVIYLPMHDGLQSRMFTARNSDTFPLIGHITREGMHHLMDHQ